MGLSLGEGSNCSCLNEGALNALWVHMSAQQGLLNCPTQGLWAGMPAGKRP